MRCRDNSSEILSLSWQSSTVAPCSTVSTNTCAMILAKWYRQCTAQTIQTPPALKGSFFFSLILVQRNSQTPRITSHYSLQWWHPERLPLQTTPTHKCIFPEQDASLTLAGISAFSSISLVPLTTEHWLPINKIIRETEAKVVEKIAIWLCLTLIWSEALSHSYILKNCDPGVW